MNPKRQRCGEAPAASCTVTVTGCPDAASFRRDYVEECHPVLIRGGLDVQRWPALKSWVVPGYLATQHATTPVSVELSQSSEFSGDDRVRSSVDLQFATAARMHEEMEERSDLMHCYLAQCPIYSSLPGQPAVLPGLQSGIDLEPPLLDAVGGLPPLEVVQANLWMSLRRRTVRSTMHYDAHHNLLCVIRGVKRIKILSPCAVLGGELRPRPIHRRSANHATGVPSVCAVIEVRRGDLLFIPEGYWHEVESDPLTLGVNLWFNGLRPTLCASRAMGPYYARVILEDLVLKERDRRLREMRAAMPTPDALSVHQPGEELLQCLSRGGGAAALRAICTLGPGEMRQILPLLASSLPDRWDLMLREATPECAAMLTSSWEAMENDEAFDFYEAIFAPLGEERAKAVKHSLLDASEAFSERVCSDVLRHVVGL